MRHLTLVMMIMIAILSGANPNNVSTMGFYSETMAIINVDYDTDTVEAMDFNGNVWSFTGCEDYYEGDLIAVTMCDNGTTNTIYDDIIIDTKYSGWVSEWGYDTDSKEPLIVFE